MSAIYMLRLELLYGNKLTATTIGAAYLTTNGIEAMKRRLVGLTCLEILAAGLRTRVTGTAIASDGVVACLSL
jgi:hypothetical protein